MAIMPWQQIEGTTGSSLCMSRSGLPVFYILITRIYIIIHYSVIGKIAVFELTVLLQMHQQTAWLYIIMYIINYIFRRSQPPKHKLSTIMLCRTRYTHLSNKRISMIVIYNYNYKSKLLCDYLPFYSSFSKDQSSFTQYHQISLSILYINIIIL